MNSLNVKAEQAPKHRFSGLPPPMNLNAGPSSRSSGPIVGDTSASYPITHSRGFSSSSSGSLGERVFRKHAQTIHSTSAHSDSKTNPIRKVSISRLPPAMQAQYLGMQTSDFASKQGSHSSSISSGGSGRAGDPSIVDDAPGKPPPGPPPNHLPSARYNTRPTSQRVKTLSKRLSERPLTGGSTKRQKTLAKDLRQDKDKGSSCHQCKSRRPLDQLIWCTHAADKSSKHCRKKYCDHCMRKFYNEDLGILSDDDRQCWVCPSCRRMCSCAACRRREGKSRDYEYDQGAEAYVEDYTSHDFPSASRTNRDVADQSGLHTLPADRQQQDYGAGPPGGTQVDDDEYEDSIASQDGDESDGDVSRRSSDIPNSGNPSFALLYAVAQMPAVKLQIQQILARSDDSDAKKVESIASLLRSSVSNESAQRC